MIYLLIDNASLLNLIHDVSTEDYVGLLETLIEDRTIALFSHETLNIEWFDHKYDWKKRLQKNENPKKDQSNKQELEKKYQRNVDKLDKLLLNVRETFSTNQGLEQESISRYKANEAPFRKGSLNGLKDWNILGSLCYYCEKHQKDELYFISHNHTDFADPTNLSEIDPTIANRFPTVRINYFKNYSDFFNSDEVRKIKGINDNIALSDQKLNLFNKSNISSKRRPKIVDSLYNIFENIYEELTHIPPKYLVRLYPFSKSLSEIAGYRNFEIDTQNEALLRFFESLDVADKKLTVTDEWFIKNGENNQERLETVIRRLRECLVYSIGNRKNERTVSIPKFQNSPLQELEESYYQFSFNKVSVRNYEQKESNRNKLKRAYIYFQLGDTYGAYSLMNEVRRKSKRSRKHLTYIIATFSLSQLYESIRWTNQNDNRFSKHILKQLSEIDVDTEINKYKYETHTEIAEMLEGYRCFYHTLEKITKITSSINSQYQSQLIGGRANNNYAYELINHFNDLDTFFCENGILFDHFSDYKDLFDNVFRGLISSIAIKNGRGSRLGALDDYLINKIITYCDRGNIISVMNHYKINQLPYESDRGEYSFNEIANNFFICLEDREFVEKVSTNYKFAEKLRRYLENFLVLGSYIDLRENEISRFVEGAIKLYLINSTFPRFSHNISKLIEIRGKFVQEDILKNLIDHCRKHLNIENNALIGESLDALLDKNYIIDDQEFINNLIALETSEFISPLLYNEILIQLASLTSNSDRQRIIDMVTSRCYIPGSAHITCLAISDDIIKFSKEEFVSLIDSLDFSNRYPIENIFFTSKEPIYKFREVDHFINTCFARGLETNTEVFESIKQLNEYYNWLLDMDNFDYNLFNGEWILHLNTKHCFDRMALSTPLLKYLYKNKNDFQDHRVDSAITEIFSRLILSSQTD